MRTLREMTIQVLPVGGQGTVCIHLEAMLRLLLLCAYFTSSGSMALSPEGVARRLARAKKANSWQKRLDKALLDVDVVAAQSALS